jgi:hypothetical protein
VTDAVPVPLAGGLTREPRPFFSSEYRSIGRVDFSVPRSFTNSTAVEENCRVALDTRFYGLVRGKLGSTGGVNLKGDLHDAYVLGFDYNDGRNKQTISRNMKVTMKMGFGTIDTYGFCLVKASSGLCSAAPRGGGPIQLKTYRPGDKLFNVLTVDMPASQDGDCAVAPQCPLSATRQPRALDPPNPVSLEFVPQLPRVAYDIGRSSAYAIEVR